MEWKTGAIAAAALGIGAAAWTIARNRGGMALRGKTVLVTGGSRGLGLQLAREFGAEGSRLVICARDPEELERARRDLVGRGIDVRVITCDITDREQVAGMAREAGAVDVLVNNAGMIAVGPIETMTIEDFEHAMDVMFWGALHVTLAVLPSMRSRREGRIVNITSVGGKVSVPHLIPYSCAKFALVALSEGLRAELSSSGIKVVTIVPGLMRTGSHLNAKFKGQHAREFGWFSLGAATPFISISAERAARSIVRSTKRGDAESILSVPANLAARFNGAFPELIAPLMAIANQFLPSAPDAETKLEPGHEAQRRMNSRLFESATQMGRSAAERLNELPART
jgi:short-subunit dehydrogenase